LVRLLNNQNKFTKYRNIINNSRRSNNKARLITAIKKNNNNTARHVIMGTKSYTTRAIGAAGTLARALSGAYTHVAKPVALAAYTHVAKPAALAAYTAVTGATGSASTAVTGATGSASNSNNNDGNSKKSKNSASVQPTNLKKARPASTRNTPGVVGNSQPNPNHKPTVTTRSMSQKNR
jgi:hypothetical protein